MSSWNKASKVGQKFHKERAQLKERESIGFLEKKKDYKLRALDYQKKHETLKHLKRKALEKNPDEFYFNMTRTEMKEGVHQLRDSFKEYTEDEIKLMKTQDKNYIKMRHQIEMHKVNRLKNKNLLLDVEGAPTNEHKFFVESALEARQFDPVKQFNTHEALMQRKSNRLTLNQLKSAEFTAANWIDHEFMREMAKARSKRYKELVTRFKRLESLRKLESSYGLKTTKIEPEEEYDQKYGASSENKELNQIFKPKIIPRKK